MYEEACTRTPRRRTSGKGDSEHQGLCHESLTDDDSLLTIGDESPVSPKECGSLRLGKLRHGRVGSVSFENCVPDFVNHMLKYD